MITAALAAAAALACGDPEPTAVTIQFRAQVAGEPFSCTATYEGLGTTNASVQFTDLRLYVHDVRLVRESGEEVPLTLEEGDFQSDRVALLDFETREGTCQNGTAETHDAITGAAPGFGDYVGLRFTVGVPAELDHLDSATSPAPLNVPGMFWSWAAGYRYLRVDMITSANPSFVFHMGSSGCDGTPDDGFTCAYEHRAEIALDDFDPTREAVAIDLAALLARTDLDFINDPDSDPIPGCMSGVDDPQCPDLYAPLGIPFREDSPAEDPQAVFKALVGAQ